jgi:hypothetical protein
MICVKGCRDGRGREGTECCLEGHLVVMINWHDCIGDAPAEKIASIRYRATEQKEHGNEICRYITFLSQMATRDSRLILRASRALLLQACSTGHEGLKGISTKNYVLANWAVFQLNAFCITIAMGCRSVEGAN